jgi:hypothetical protein
VSNIEKTLKVLDIDLYTYVVDWEEFKDLQIAFIKSSIPNLEIPTDHGICSILYQLANKFNIKYIMSGSNVTTEAIMPALWMGGNQVQYYANIMDIHSRYGTKKFKTYPKTSFTEFLYYTFIKKIRIINILNYIKYNKREALDILKTELSYTEYANKHYESIYTRFFQAYILPKKYNMDKRLPHLSTLVASKQITRDYALSELEKPICDPALLAEDKAFVIKKFGFTEQEFETLMHEKPRPYTDFKNYDFIFNYFYGAAKYIRKLILKA